MMVRLLIGMKGDIPADISLTISLLLIGLAGIRGCAREKLNYQEKEGNGKRYGKMV